MSGKHKLSRRQWLISTAVSLSGCGGGDSSTAGLPGTGGTGIGVDGVVRGFGSVMLNNTHFDESTARINIDGIAKSAADLRIGMLAKIVGTKNISTSTGVAASIDIWSTFIGQVTAINISANTLEIAGVTVLSAPSTVFSGITNFAGFSVGMWVSIWALQASVDASRWQASRIQLLVAYAGPTITTGILHVAGPLSQVNNLLLAGSVTSNLYNLKMVRVQGALAGPTLTATQVTVLVPLQALSSNDDVELEGLVTSIGSAVNFYAGGQLVDATNATISPSNHVLTVNDQLVVTGVIVNDVLNAKKIDIKTTTALSSVDITGLVEHIDASSPIEFSVRGQRFSVGSGTIVTGGLVAAMVVGQKVRAQGRISGEDAIVASNLNLNVP